MNIVRKRISFRGEVQAVGFRYKACHFARDYGVTGWVENEWDGSVLMEAQGTQEAIDAVIYHLEMDRYIVIDSYDVKEIPLVKTERGFGVKGY